MDNTEYSVRLDKNKIMVTTPNGETVFDPSTYYARINPSSIEFFGKFNHPATLVFLRSPITPTRSWYIREVVDTKPDDETITRARMFDEPEITYQQLLAHVLENKYIMHMHSLAPDRGAGEKHELVVDDNKLVFIDADGHPHEPEVVDLTHAPTGTQITLKFPRGSFDSMKYFGLQDPETGVLVYEEDIDRWVLKFRVKGFGWVPAALASPGRKQEVLPWAEKQLEA